MGRKTEGILKPQRSLNSTFICLNIKGTYKKQTKNIFKKALPTIISSAWLRTQSSQPNGEIICPQVK